MRKPNTPTYKTLNWPAYNAALKRRGWCRQTNANSSQFTSNGNLLGSEEVTPLGESGGTVGLEAFSTGKGALLVEMIVQCGVDGYELL